MTLFVIQLLYNAFCRKALATTGLLQTVESPKGLSVKICPKDVPRVISLITKGTFRGKIFQTIPKDSPLFVRLWASKTKEDVAQSCPICLSGETVGSDLLKYDCVKSSLWGLKNNVC